MTPSTCSTLSPEGETPKHALSAHVEESAGPYAWESTWQRNPVRNDERWPGWYAHLRRCEECARNYLTVPAEEARYCAAGKRVKDGPCGPKCSAEEINARGAKNRAKRLRREERARRRAQEAK
jgi:hypothetical protein